ncbi:MAG: radical SAM family heme chaperone HemW [Deltaproteobacteria bacterium]
MNTKKQKVLTQQAGLYIHIPFCNRKCSYCSFYSVTDTSFIPEFIIKLEEEMILYQNQFSAFDSVYLGGGTPSILTEKQIETILDSVRKYFLINTDAEITIETNPTNTNINFFKALRNLGVNRLNIGCQSFNDATLAFLGRLHNRKQSLKSIDDARKAGFENIGVDLIYGIPSLANNNQFTIWQDTLKQVIAIQPEHLSCYQLSLEAGTPMSKEGKLLPDEKLQAQYFFHTSETLITAGYQHYEISNFAKGTHLRSRHNSSYWNHSQYLGIGPASHSFDGYQRWWNHCDLSLWLNALSDKTSPVAGSEMLNQAQRNLEMLFLGLRTDTGINLEKYYATCEENTLAKKRILIDNFIAEGFLYVSDRNLCPTIKGFAIADALASTLC